MIEKIKINPLPSKETLDALFSLDGKYGQLYWKNRPDIKAVGRQAYIDRRVYNKGRIIWKMTHGDDPIGCIFHIDLDKTNFAPSNLMDVYQVSLPNVDGHFHCKICTSTFDVVHRVQYEAVEPEEVVKQSIKNKYGRKKISILKTSSVEGVTWDKSRKKWMAYIRVDGRQITLGRFKTLEAAKAARKAVEHNHTTLKSN